MPGLESEMRNAASALNSRLQSVGELFNVKNGVGHVNLICFLQYLFGQLGMECKINVPESERQQTRRHQTTMQLGHHN